MNKGEIDRILGFVEGVLISGAVTLNPFLFIGGLVGTMIMIPIWCLKYEQLKEEKGA